MIYFALVISSYLIWAKIVGDNSTGSYTPEGLIKLVHKSVSSQSNMIAVS
jgi:hypothetical protein